MPTKTFGKKGQSILSVMIAAAIVVIASVYFLSAIPRSRRKSQELYQKLVAQAFATELLETFRSFRDDHLLEYLRLNPVGYNNCTYANQSNCGPTSLYKFCAHINILDRSSGTIVNNDPIADLPPSILDFPQTNTASDPNLAAKYKANRYYQVQIVDTNPAGSPGTLAIAKNACACEGNQFKLTAMLSPPAGTTFLTNFGNAETACPNAAINPPGFSLNGGQLSSTQKFLITVGVSWIPSGKTLNDVDRIVLSTLLPDNHS